MRLTEADFERATAEVEDDRAQDLADLNGAAIRLYPDGLLEGAIGPIRDVETSPDGFLYLLTDEGDGALDRLQPATDRDPA